MLKVDIPNIDHFFQKINNGILIDIFGASGTGKTQLALQFSLYSLSQGNVIFHDTTGGFRPERLMHFIKSKNLPISLLEKFKVARITNTSEQINHLSKIYEENHLSLLIIDNVTDLFSFEYSKKSQLLAKNISFLKYVHDLTQISSELKIPVLLTNMIRYSTDSEVENLEKEISLFTHFKIKLSKKLNFFTCNLMSPFQHDQFNYTITNDGIKKIP